MRAFTLVEILVIVGILVVLTAIAVPAFRSFEKETDLNNASEEIINSLRLAQAKTLGSEGASQWGVYFSVSVDPHQYTLFKGTDYAGRDPSFDDISKLPSKVEIYELDLQEAANQVVFERINGTTNNNGKVSLRLKTNPAKNKTIYIENSGRIGLTAPYGPSDSNRLKDSRHVHFDYSRAIATITESLILTFEGGVVKTIVITDNIKDEQIYWEGEVNVAGAVQKLKIHTHRLNDALSGSQFCFHRDRRYNNKALTVTISGDISGSPQGELIRYTATGGETQGSSFFVGEPQRQ